MFRPIRGLNVTACLFHPSSYQILHISYVFLVTLLLVFACFFSFPLLSLIQFSYPINKAIFFVVVHLLWPSIHKFIFIVPFCFLYYIGFSFCKRYQILTYFFKFSHKIFRSHRCLSSKSSRFFNCYC